MCVVLTDVCVAAGWFSSRAWFGALFTVVLADACRKASEPLPLGKCICHVSVHGATQPHALLCCSRVPVGVALRGAAHAGREAAAQLMGAHIEMFTFFSVELAIFEGECATSFRWRLGRLHHSAI